MAVPIINDVVPSSGLSGGGELIRIIGKDFADDLIVLFGEAKAAVISVLGDNDERAITCHSPSHLPGGVDVIVKNADAKGKLIPGEVGILTDGFNFHRPSIAKESDLTRLVRTILRELKKQLIENTSISVSLNYDSTPDDRLSIIEVAKLPSILISGPNVAENRFYSTNEFREELVSHGDVPEVVRWRSPFTTDLSFRLTCASDNPAELHCAARGQCSCVSLLPGDKRLLSTSLTIPAGETLKRLPGALLAVKEIAKAIGKGELRVKHYRTWSKSKAATKPKKTKTQRKSK